MGIVMAFLRNYIWNKRKKPMNFKLLIPLLFLASITTQCSFIEIEHEEDLIIQIEGKWKLISVTFDGKQNIEGKIVPVLITSYNQNNLFGEIKLNKDIKAA